MKRTIAGLEFDVSRSARQFLVVSFRATSLEAIGGTYIAFARCDASSGSLAAARRRQRDEAQYSGPGVAVVILDRDSGLVV